MAIRYLLAFLLRPIVVDSSADHLLLLTLDRRRRLNAIDFDNAITMAYLEIWTQLDRGQPSLVD